MCVGVGRGDRDFGMDSGSSHLFETELWVLADAPIATGCQKRRRDMMKKLKRISAEPHKVVVGSPPWTWLLSNSVPSLTALLL